MFLRGRSNGSLVGTSEHALMDHLAIGTWPLGGWSCFLASWPTRTSRGAVFNPRTN